jgi:D-3-phosphoglycerate dehydrogenase
MLVMLKAGLFKRVTTKADVLSLHILTPETNQMVDAFVDAFRSLWVFNTSRENNVVTADLVSAMNTGKVLGQD